MKQTTRIAIAALLHSAGKVLSAFAFEFGGTEAVGEPEAQPETTPDPEKPRRGRKAAAVAPSSPEAPTVDATGSVEPAAPTVTGKTYEELKAIIKPVVEAGNGEDVKKVITKYATNLKELESKPEHHEAFEKEITALVY